MRLSKKLITALALLPLTACAAPGPQGRIMAQGEAVGVGQSNAGIAVYDEILVDTLEKLLAQHRQQVNVQGRYRVAFVEIDTAGAEELRDHKEAMFDRIEEVVVNAGMYTLVSKRQVDAGRKAAGIRTADDLFIAANRQALSDALGGDSGAPDYFMWAKTTTQSTKVSSREDQRRYRMSIDMIDASTGNVIAKQSGERIKSYTR